VSRLPIVMLVVVGLLGSANGARAEDLACLSTTFRFLGPNDKVCIRSNAVRHFGAPRTSRLRRARRRIPGGLMLYFSIELAAHQDHDRRHPHPDHETNNGAQRAVGLVEAAKVGRIPGKIAEPDSLTIAANALPQLIHRHRGSARSGPYR
jgi:hypothetical protein